MSATAIRSLHPAYQEHHDRRGRVMVADHDGFARRLIQNALQDDGGVLTLPAAKDARELLELVRHYRPTVLILDTGLADGGCVQLIGEVLLIAPDTRILTVSADEDQTALGAWDSNTQPH